MSQRIHHMSQYRPFNTDHHFIPLQNKKIFCAYHPNQFLTNFCKEAECLMPLCPSCISEHTQQHFLNQKKPSYQNLNQALNNAKENCYLNIVTLENYRLENQDIYEYILTLEQNIHLQLQSNKLQIFELISKLFNEFEQKLVKQIVNNYQIKKVYNRQESVNASTFIDQQINTLYQKISALKGEDCLGALITYHAQDKQNYQETLSEFKEYLENNKKTGKIKICLNQENLKQITVNMCQNLLNIQSIVQQQEASQVCIQTENRPRRFRLQQNNNHQIIQKQNKNMNMNVNVNVSERQKQKSQIKKIKIEVLSPAKKKIRQRQNQQLIKNINQTQLANESISSRKVMYDSSTNKESKRLTRTYKQQ